MAQAPSVAIPSRLPLILQPENRDASSERDAKLVDGYMEKGVREGETWIYKRPGLQRAELGVLELAGPGRGIYNWLGAVFVVVGTSMYRCDTFPVPIGGAVFLGTVDDNGHVYTFSTCLGDHPTLQMQNGRTAYNCDFLLGPAEISQVVQDLAISLIEGVTYTIASVGTTNFMLVGASANTVGTIFIASGPTPGNGIATRSNENFPVYPNLVPGWAYLDGTTYVMDRSAYIHGSTTLPGMNRPDVWEDLTNVIGAQIEPDRGVCLAKQLVYVVALKEWSTEVFYDAMNPPGASPLSPVQGAKINYGCASAASVQEIDGMLIWASTNRAASVQVLLLDNLKPTIISTKAVERLLIDADFSEVYSLGFKYEGHRFYVLTLRNSKLSLVYDLTDKMWSQWTDGVGGDFRGVSNTFFGVHRVVQDEAEGLFFLSGSYYTDYDHPITVDLYTPNFDGGVRRRKHLNQMEFIADQTEGSVIQVRTNDDDYEALKWSSFREVDLSVKRPLLVNCGTFYRRATHIRHACDTPFRLQAIELQLDIGTL